MNITGSSADYLQVQAISLIEVVQSDGKWLINTIYSECNSLAWTVNLGFYKGVSNCTA